MKLVCHPGVSPLNFKVRVFPRVAVGFRKLTSRPSPWSHCSLMVKVLLSSSHAAFWSADEITAEGFSSNPSIAILPREQRTPNPFNSAEGAILISNCSSPFQAMFPDLSPPLSPTMSCFPPKVFEVLKESCRSVVVKDCTMPSRGN